MPKSKRARPAPGKKTASPSEIAPGVFVGGWKDALTFRGARFCVLDEAPEGIDGAVHIPLFDAESGGAIRANLERLAREIGAAREHGSPVLVFCGHGVRRSPLGGAWYLHRAERVPLEEAYRRIRSVRPQVETAEEWLGNVESLRDD